MPSTKRLSHIMIEGPDNTHGYINPNPGRGKSFLSPPRERASHANYISQRLKKAWDDADSNLVASCKTKHGVYLEFRGQAGHDLATQSLETMGNNQIRICNIQTKKEKVVDDNDQTEIKPVTYATVYVPNEQRQYFSKKVEDYAQKEIDKSVGRDKIFPKFDEYKLQLEDIFVDINASKKLKLKPEVLNTDIDALANNGVPSELILMLRKKPRNAKLVEGIEDVQKAIARSFWVDHQDLFPQTDREWCEVWLRDNYEDDVERQFIELANTLNLPIKEGNIRFPERIVKLIHISGDELETLQNSCDWIAEFRKAKETADFWIEQPNQAQSSWVTDLNERMNVDPESLVSVCILDTGINNGHPLLSPIIRDEDKHTVKEEWGTHDHDGHGTLMAGLAVFGDIQGHLEGTEKITIPHVVESAKIYPPPPEENPRELWGDITSQGINRAEIQAPDRKRIICMAVTAKDGRERGRPSSWSGAVDQLIAGTDNNTKRLFLISAGNFTCGLQDIKNYPDVQVTDLIHDPAQAWNAVTVGAYTNLTQLADPTMNGYIPVASEGELSPYSTTSFDWETKWPIKPEVVFEGGNVAKEESSGFVSECNDLSLISTHYKPHETHFEPFRMTSAAVAQAAHFAAKIQAEYPNYWPETVRALMVHSAEWTDGMKKQFAEDNPGKKIGRLLKACGYGVPNLDKALYCSSSSLTLVAQTTLQPYQQEGNLDPKNKDMHFYELPWPTSVLQEMDDVMVRMRITLSYFIEPGPGEIGWQDRYRYPSHLLRFDVNSPFESKDDFLRKINKAMRDDGNEYLSKASTSKYWVIGSQNRDKGSIHSDIWEGTAADLAASNLIAVYPKIGWWNKRKHLNKANSQARYALIVSIETPEQDVDIYSPVATKVEVPVSISAEDN